MTIVARNVNTRKHHELRTKRNHTEKVKVLTNGITMNRAKVFLDVLTSNLKTIKRMLNSPSYPEANADKPTFKGRQTSVLGLTIKPVG